MIERADQGEQGLPVNIGNLDSGGSLLLAAGILAVFQRTSEVIALAGLVALALGTVAMVGALVLRRAPWARIVERLTVIGMVVGILGMLQHWHIWLYEYGFYLLLISTVSFIAILHVPVKDEEE